jgi:hypothetical protein
MDRQDLVYITNTKSTKGVATASLGGTVTESQGVWHITFSPNVSKKQHEQEMNQTPFFALAFVIASFFAFIYRERVVNLANDVMGVLLRDDKKKK